MLVAIKNELHTKQQQVKEDDTTDKKGKSVLQSTDSISTELTDKVNTLIKKVCQSRLDGYNVWPITRNMAEMSYRAQMAWTLRCEEERILNEFIKN